MRICVKIGGTLLEDAARLVQLARSLCAARAAGHQLLVVHGGGRQIQELAGRLGLEERRHEGLRVTDRDTARVVTWVLAGEVNKALVQALCSAGAPALGLSGADLGLFSPRRKRAGTVDLGHVGELSAENIDADRLRALLAQGYLPVLATIGPARDASGPGEPFLNVNADEAAGPIAAAAGAEELVFLSDVPGVRGADGQVIGSLRGSERHELIAAGVIQDGMIPKVRAAQAALDAGVPRARILTGEQDDPLGAALRGGGTEILP
ncbi:MAG: acetylglutamate kinase [Planctomycetota bacterium]